MTQHRTSAGLQNRHAALWYGSAPYRLAWTILPQALVALVMAVLIMGGGLSRFPFADFGSDQGITKSEWGTPAEEIADADALDKIRDAIADNSDPGGLEQLEKLAAAGSKMAAYKLATLFDPTQAGTYPYPLEKDAIRALGYFQVPADAGNFAAIARITILRLLPDTPEYDPAIGCVMAKSLMNDPDIAPGKRREDDAWYLLQAADCYAGILRPKDTPVPILTLEDAQKALELYNDPFVLPFSHAKAGIAHVYLALGSPVHDLIKGCENVRNWIGQSNTELDNIDHFDRFFLNEVSNCLLGTSGRKTTEDYTPQLKDEQAALTIWQLPMMADYPIAVSALAWFNLNKAHQLGAPKNGCDQMQQWADLTDGAASETAKLSDWLIVMGANCLLGDAPNTGATPLTQRHRMIGVSMLESIAKTNNWAAVNLGFLYEFGAEGIPVDMDRARTIYQACAAKGGETKCNERFGIFKRFGMGGLAVDLDGALLEFNKCLNVGESYCNAQVVAVWEKQDSPHFRNDAEVLGHLQAAIDGGNGYGTWRYAVAVYNGEHGLRADHEAAALWFIRSLAAQDGTASFTAFRDDVAPEISDSAFWLSFHTELARRGVYSEAIAKKPSAATFEAVKKLLR